MATERFFPRGLLAGAVVLLGLLLIAVGWLARRNYQLEQRLIVHEARIRYLSGLEDAPYTDKLAVSLRSGDEREEIKERLDGRYRREAKYKYFMEPLGLPLPTERSSAVPSPVSRSVAGRRR